MGYYRRYHPRENRWYVEVDDEYLRRLESLESLEREMRDHLSSRAGKRGLK